MVMQGLEEDDAGSQGERDSQMSEDEDGDAGMSSCAYLLKHMIKYVIQAKTRMAVTMWTMIGARLEPLRRLVAAIILLIVNLLLCRRIPSKVDRKCTLAMPPLKI
jgi:hypothetical protein